jgi:hypothetical protein
MGLRTRVVTKRFHLRSPFIFAITLCCGFLTADAGRTLHGSSTVARLQTSGQSVNTCAECQRKAEGDCYQQLLECEKEALEKSRTALEVCNGIQDLERCRACRQSAGRIFEYGLTACNADFRIHMRNVSKKCDLPCSSDK